MKTKNAQSTPAGARQGSGLLARVSMCWKICLILVLGWVCRSPAQIILCGPLFEVYSANVRAEPAFTQESGTHPAAFVFEVVGGSPFSGTTLTLQFSGTATNGVDCQSLTTQVTLPGGSGPKQAVLEVVPIPDSLVEGTETVTVRIIASSSQCISIGTPSEATVFITDGADIPLATALDDTNLIWTTGGDRAWASQAIVTHDGTDAAQSGPVLDDQESWLETAVIGPGTLTFWWRVSSEQDFDWLRFHMDGVLQQQISGEVNWQYRSISVPDGPHVLRWRYIKDLYDNAGQNTAWLDDVRFTPASGPLAIVSPPAHHTVWPGANVTLNPVVLGAAPLSYQWYFNETHAIPGATRSTLTLNNLRLGDAGRYHVVISNNLGSVPSAAATVTLTNNGPATSVLLFMDGALPSPYETALSQLGYPYQKFTSEPAFSQAVAAANRNNTLVLLDATDWAYNLASVRSFIGSGGRALVQAYTLIADPALATALKVTLERRFLTPSPVHDWSGSPFFRGLSSPLNLVDAGYYENGYTLHVMAGGYGVAGFGAAVEPGEAVVVIGNAGRTIVNGFFLEDATSSADAVRFAKNQIDFLINPVLPIELLSPQWVEGEFQLQIAGGRAGLACSLQAWDASMQWVSVTNVTLSASPVLISVPASAPWSLYQATMSLP